MKVEGLEEGPRTPTKKEIQPSLNLDEIPSDDDDDGSVDYDALEDTEVNVDLYRFGESVKNEEVSVIPDDSDPEEVLSKFKNRLFLEINTASNRYLEYVLPIANQKNADKNREITPVALMKMQLDLIRSIEIKEAPDGRKYLDVGEVNSKVEKFYSDINSSYRAVALKNGYNYRGIYRRTTVNSTENRTFGDSRWGEYLSLKAENATNDELKKAYPTIFNQKQKTLTELIGNLENKPLDLQQRLRGYSEVSRRAEFDRLMDDEDFKSSLGREIANFYGSGAERYFLPRDEFDSFSAGLDESEKTLFSNTTNLIQKVFALKTVGGFDPTLPARRYFKSKDGNTIIELPEGSNKNTLSPSVNMDYIQAAVEAADRSVKPDKSSIVRKINFTNTSDYSGKVEAGELGHSNSATLEINIFMDRLSDANDKYNAAPPEEKDKMIARFASPNAWDSMESLYKYTVAHELGHIMAFSIWDHNEINSNSNKSGPPTWRFRSGLAEMQKEINPLKQLEPISEYGKESTDEYWAEAYAKWIVDNEASDSFKKILDDYGLVRGKARRWVTDDTSTNPAGRASLPESATTALSDIGKIDADQLTQAAEEAFDNIPYVGEYGEEATKEQLKNVQDILGLVAGIVESKSVGVNIAYTLRHMNDNWNGDSNYTSGIATMYALREEFDIQNALPITGRAVAGDTKFEDRKKKLEKVEKGFTKNPEALKLFRQILRANYNVAQKALSDAGVEELLLYRGWRSASDVRSKVVVPSRPINSFSLEEDVARRFVGSQGSLTAVVVPKESIWSFWKLLRGGVEGESEVLLLGGAREMYAYAWNEWPKMEDIVGTGKEVLVD